MRERSASPAASASRGRALEPADRLLGVGAAVVDPACADLERGPALSIAVRRRRRLEPGKAVVARGECLVVLAHQLEHRRLLAEQARIENRVVGRGGLRAPPRGPRTPGRRRRTARRRRRAARGRAPALSHSTSSRCSAAASARSKSSAAMTFANLACGALAGEHPVAPGALVVARLVEVEREQCRLLVGLRRRRAARAPRRRGRGSVGGAGTRGPRRPWRERDRGGRRARRRRAGTTNSPSATQRSRSPASGISSARISPEQVEVEGRPDHGCVPEQHPVGRVERVDPRRQQALDRLRQLVDRRAVLRREHELADEERVAARALRRAPTASTESANALPRRSRAPRRPLR